mgnify:CR=1 FL=1
MNERNKIQRRRKSFLAKKIHLYDDDDDNDNFPNRKQTNKQ